MHILIVDTVDRHIVAIDPGLNNDGQPVLPENYPNPVKVVEVTNPQFQVFLNATHATFTADDDGTIHATEIPLPPPSDFEVARSDIKTTAQAAVDRMDQIVTQTQTVIDMTSPTNAQVVAAVKQLAAQVQDEARAIKRTIRYLQTGG